MVKFPAHADKIQIVKFHPFVKDIILTSAFDRSVKVWDLSDNEEPKFELEVQLFITKICLGCCV